jgi:TrmH family RNA methyltransferase
MLRGLSICLVEPAYEVNVGYAARLVKNFGAKELILVNPRVNLDSCKKFASHAADTLEDSAVHQDIDEIEKRFEMIIGTTAIRARKPSNVSRITVTPEDGTHAVQRSLESSRPTCLLLGRDTTGLTNYELEKCDLVITIPTRSRYQTLNISHALAILLYLFNEPSKSAPRRKKDLAGRKDRQRLVDNALKLAGASGIPRYRVPMLKKSLRLILGRSQPNKKEVFLLMGLFRKATAAIERSKRTQ